MATRMSGAEVVVRALEDERVPFAFGIPGAQNLALYDVLATSSMVRPILVTDEQCASFMADGAWRASGRLCCVNLVPGAGLTHALSGIAEAFMDGIPMLVLSSAVRSDLGKAFQLHDIDQLALACPITKAQFHVSHAADLYDTVRRACHLSRTAPAGPVMVEVPANLLTFHHEQHIGDWHAPAATPHQPSPEGLAEAIRMISASRRPLLYLGIGAAGAGRSLASLAEKLEAPICTTIQGKGIVPESHPLFLWCGFGPTAPPFVRAIADDCDLTIAIGCRFGEVATGSYGLKPPGALIHVDIDSCVFGKNYPATLAIEADAAALVSALRERLTERAIDTDMRAAILAGHEGVRAEWMKASDDGPVSPPQLLSALQKSFGEKAIFVADSGNGLFEAMESLRLEHPRSFLAPVDFSCMGYAVPAAIGAALAAPDRPVVALEGDGALLMTGLELVTASQLEVPVVVVVLRDRHLAQITQFQKTAFVRTPSSTLADFNLKTLCDAIRVTHFPLNSDRRHPRRCRGVEAGPRNPSPSPHRGRHGRGFSHLLHTRGREDEFRQAALGGASSLRRPRARTPPDGCCIATVKAKDRRSQPDSSSALRRRLTAGIPISSTNAFRDWDPLLVGDRLKLSETGLGVFGRIDRLHYCSATPRIAPVQLLDFELLDVGGIGKHHRAQVQRRTGCMNGTGEPVLHQLWQQPAMINVRMSEDHGVNRFGCKWKRPVVELSLRFGTLEHAAVDQDLRAIGFEQET